MDMIKDILEIISKLGGLAAIPFVCKYLFDLFKIKFGSSEKKAEQKHKGSVDEKTHISKTQFNKEFEIYQDLWISIVELMEAATAFRPLSGSLDPIEEDDEEKMNHKVDNLTNAVRKFYTYFEKCKPFYAKDVYNKSDTLNKLCHREQLQYICLKPNDENYWKNAFESSNKIIEQGNDCCEAIRNRMDSLKVID